MITTMIELRKDVQSKYQTHIEVFTVSCATHYLLVGMFPDGIPRSHRDVEYNLIKHENKVQRLSKKMAQEYHNKAIELAKEKYKHLL